MKTEMSDVKKTLNEIKTQLKSNQEDEEFKLFSDSKNKSVRLTS